MIELLCPPSYTGEFATLSEHENRGKQLTLWQFGEPKWHADGTSFEEALQHIFAAGWNWASNQMKIVFEQDVIIAGAEQ